MSAAIIDFTSARPSRSHARQRRREVPRGSIEAKVRELVRVKPHAAMIVEEVIDRLLQEADDQDA